MEGARAKAIVREYFYRLLNERDLTVCEELLAPDYVDHDAPEDTPPGPAGTREFVAAFLEEYPDLRLSIREIIAEGNTVAARNIWQATHWETGEELNQMGLVLLRVNEAGQIAERWSAYKSLD